MTARARLVLALLVVASPAQAAPDPDQQTFDAAVARSAGGDYRGAAAALVALARAHPDSEWADDALFEAAVLSEERLADPTGAAALYQEVAARYPSSRLARRARTRADFLTTSLRSGAAAFIEHQRIVADAAHPREAVAAMERLLAAHADFALADRALFWLGARLVEQHRDADALARFAELEHRFPASEWSGRARKSHADLLLAQGHVAAARALYDELAASTDPIARAAGREGRLAADKTVQRGALAVAALLYLLAFVAAHLWALRRGGLGRAPAELVYYAPVAALFAAAAATENAAIAWATLGIAAGGGVIVWLAGALSAAPTPTRRPALLARAAATALAVLALAFLAVHRTGLTDLVAETLRNGPDR